MDPAGPRLTAGSSSGGSFWAMIKRRPAAAGLPPSTCCHAFRATGGSPRTCRTEGTLEHAQQIAGHASPPLPKLYDRTADTVTADEIKELLDGLQIDRTSCCKFLPNQLRVLLTAAAYVLMQELRLRAARTGCARTQVTWMRDRLLKLGVHVVGSARRIVLHLPRATPHLHAWRRIALALGARAG